MRGGFSIVLLMRLSARPVFTETDFLRQSSDVVSWSCVDQSEMGVVREPIVLCISYVAGQYNERPGELARPGQQLTTC